MSASTERIFEDLNPPQREAVETLDGPLLILAGAGSGKTRVVTRRIANLIAHGVRPWEILAITFTNKAAGEMRVRVEDLVGASGVWLSTFHSFGARVLRREAAALDLSPNFTIYDEDDTLAVLKDITRRLGLSEDKRYTPRAVRQLISNFKNHARGLEDLREGDFEERLVKQAYQEYDAVLRQNQALDFDDLLLRTVFMLRDHPDVLTRYQDRFRYILVDEYQDTNGCQYQLVKRLGQKHRNVCATGDPDQSIYAWRGADVLNILSFEKDFPEAKVVKLEQNYRSTKRILAAANAVIDHNQQRKPKALWTQNPEGDRIPCLVTADEQMEAYGVVKEIGRCAREGRRYNEFAVFYRTNAQSRPFETALVQSAIPYQLVGGTAFYERREVKDALAYLRLLVNPKDDLALRRILNVPRRALGPAVLETIEQHAAKTNQSLFEALAGKAGAEFIATFKPKAREGLRQFRKLFEDLQARPVYPVADVLKAALEESGLLGSLRADNESDRLENLDQLVNAAVEFDLEHDPAQARAPDGPPPEPGAYDGLEELLQRQASVAGFLENSALLAPTDNFDAEQDRVTLMTLHMAKGLEFPVVFLTGVEESLLPLLRQNNPNRTGEDSAALEEERRLMYVGMTRAKEQLHLSRVVYRRRFGRSETALPSRFLSEIPDKLLNVLKESQGAWLPVLNTPPRRPPDGAVMEDTDSAWERRRAGAAGADTSETQAAQPGAFAAFEREVESTFSDEQRPARRPSSRRHDPALQTVVDRMLDVSESQVEPDGFEPGDRVRHELFGEGVVEALTGRGAAAKLKVHFRGCGPKVLLLSMTRLQKL